MRRGCGAHRLGAIRGRPRRGSVITEGAGHGHQAFVNLPVKDLGRSRTFFTELGLTFFGQAEDMASVIISEHTQVMLLTETVFASYARNGVVDATAGTEVILVLGLETRDQVDQLAEAAETAGGSPVGTPRDDGYRYQRGFTDLDGHHWEALCLVDPAS